MPAYSTDLSFSRAQSLSVVNTGSNAAFFLTFIDSNNASTLYENLYTTSSVTVNPNTGEIDILSTLSSISTTTGALVVTGGAGIGRDLYVGGTIFGNISGTLTGNAATVSTVIRTTSADHFLTFVDANNATATAESIYTTSTLVVNPSTGNVGIATSAPTTRLDITGGLKVSGITTITNATSAASPTTGALQVAGGVGINGTLWVENSIYSKGGAIELRDETTSSIVLASIQQQGSTALFELGRTDMAFSTAIDFHSSGANTDFDARIISIGGNTATIGQARLDLIANQVYLSSTQTATSTITGALVVTGGAGIGGNLYVGGEIVAQRLTIQFTTVTTTLVQTDDIIQTLNVTNATSTITGALQVAGGAGIGRDLYVGGTIFGNISGTVTGNAGTVSTVIRTTSADHFLTFVDSNNASNTAEAIYTTSTLVVNPSTGNVGIATSAPTTRLDVTGGLRVSGITTITNTTNASSTVTGALQVAGGVGIQGDLYVYKTINVALATNGGTGIVLNNNDISGVNQIVFSDPGPGEGINFNSNYQIYESPDDLVTNTGGNLQFVANGLRRVTFDRNGQVTITTTTNASSTITGALVVTGGAGIGRDLYVGGTIYGNISGSVSGSLTNALTMNNSGSGVASGTTYDGSVARTISYNTIGAYPLTGGTLNGPLTMPQNPVGTTYASTSTMPTYYLGQVTGNDDAWKIYGEAPVTNSVTMVFETNDDNDINEKFLFRYKQTYSPYGTTNLLAFDTNSITFKSNTMIHAGNTSTAHVATANYAATAGSSSGSSGQVNTIQQTTNANHFLTFVDANNASATAESVYTTSSFTINPSTGNVAITAASSGTDGLYVNNGGQYVTIRGRMTAGANNNIVQAGDTGIIFTNGSVGTGNFVIAPWSTTSTGIRISNLGVVTLPSVINATSTITGALQVAGGAGIGRDLYVGGTIYGNISGTLTGNAANLTGGALGQIPYQTAPNATSFFGPGTAGQLLVSGGAAVPVYTNTSSIHVATANYAQNANTLDSLDSTSFLRSDSATTWNGTASGPFTVLTPNTSLGTITGQVNTLQILQQTLNTDAFMTFHISGDYAVHFGLDGTTNDLFVGGWSAGAVKNKIVHAGNTSTAHVATANYAASAGSASGASGSAATVATIQRATNAVHHLTFVDSHNLTSANELVYTTSTLVINPSTGNIGVGTASPNYRLQVNVAHPTPTTTYGVRTWNQVPPTVYLQSTTQSIGAGGTLGFGGRDSGATDYANWRIRSVFSTEGGGYGANMALLFDAVTDNTGSSNLTNILSLLGNGNVGIGTALPVNSRLQLLASESAGAVGSSAASVNITNSYTAAFGRSSDLVFSVGAGGSTEKIAGISGVYTNYTTSVGGALSFLTNNGSGSFTEKMILTSPGLLGVGTATPQYKLDVNNSGASTFQASFGSNISSGSISGIHFGYSESANQLYRKSAIIFERSDASFGDARGKVHILNGPQAGSGSATLSDAKLTIASDGNIGFGTQTPVNRLEVKGVFGAPATSGSSQNGIARFSQTTGLGSLDIGFGDPYSWIQSRSSGNYATNYNIALNPNGGNVSIGTTSTLNKFEVQGTSGQLFSVSDSFTGTIFSVNDISGIPSIEVLDTGLVKFAQYNGQVTINTATIQTGMGLTVFTSTYITSLGVGTVASGTLGEIRASNEITAYYSSDARLKENVKVISDPIQILQQIRGVRFDWKDDYIESRGGEDGFFVRKQDIGVIAQEVEAVLPELVATRDNGYKAVKYEKLVALLIESVKEQQITIDTLKAEMTEIKTWIQKTEKG